MFEWRTVPVFLALSALALAAWTATGPTSPAGWASLGLLALYGVSAIILRTGRPSPSIADANDEATRLNAARVAPPRTDRSGDAR